jgi:gamma-glutamyl-gamma-aminobutyrate hydrolase PuuD
VASSGSDAGAGDRPGTRPPRIGLTTYVEEARWGVWDRPAVVLPHSYVASVVAAGGVPVVLPPAASGPGAAAAALAGVDALVLTGGADVAPALYGAEPHPRTQGARPDRDDWEVALLRLALDADLPVLAICRGAQVLDVALGGTLHQHVPDVVGHVGHQPEPAVLGTTQVRLSPGSLTASILGEEAKVPCYHHQAVHRLGDGVVAVGWADDGTIEALEVPDRRFVVAVQWHPEDGDDPRLFEALVAAALSR